MELRLGYDFTRVRIHSGPDAVQTVRRVNRTAFTVGHDIYVGSNAPSPHSNEGRRLLTHELAHVVQQRGGGAGPAEAGSDAEQEADAAASAVSEGNRFAVRGLTGVTLARQVIRGAPAAAAKALEPLEVVAQRIARLAIGPSSAAVNLKGGPDKVVSVVRNVRTGNISVGLNTGLPANATEPIQKADSGAGSKEYRRGGGEGDAYERDGNGWWTCRSQRPGPSYRRRASSARSHDDGRGTRRDVRDAQCLARGRRRLTTAARCEHSAAITRGVKVTETLFKAEGDLGAVKVPQSGRAVKAGGKVVEADTIHGEIGAPKPPGEPGGATPERVPEVAPKVEVPGVGSVGETTVRLAVAEVALNVLLFAVTYYLDKWHAEKQVRKFNNDLKGLLPDINNRLKKRGAEILKRVRRFPSSTATSQ